MEDSQGARAQQLEGVLVLGMHRSATGVWTRLLASNGFSLGCIRDDMLADSANDAGHPEHPDVVRFNDSVLGHLGANWYTPPGQDQVHECSDEYSMRARALWRDLQVESPRRQPLALHDPRFSLLLPIWESALGSAVGHFVCVRSPVLVAQSMAVRDGISFDFALHLWEAYTLAALSSLAEREAFLVLANDLRDCPAELLQDAAEFAGADPHHLDLSALQGAHLRHEATWDLSSLTRAQYDLWMEVCSWGSGRITIPSSPRFGRQLSRALGSARTAGRRHTQSLMTTRQRDELAVRIAQVEGERDALAAQSGEDLRRLREANAMLVMEVQYARLREDLARSAEHDSEADLVAACAAAENLRRENQQLILRVERAEELEKAAQGQRVASDAKAAELSSLLTEVFASRSWRITNWIRRLLGRA